MKFELYLENKKGEALCFTQTSRAFMVTEITGLDEPNANITTSGYSTMDGSQIVNAVVPQRNITISFRMTGSSIESSRQQLYNVVKVRKPIRVRYKTNTTDVWTEGYVETCTVSNFSSETSGQISIICGDPYWYDMTLNSIVIQQIETAFKFPVTIPPTGVRFIKVITDDNTIINTGEDTGYIIAIGISGGTVMARSTIRITNNETGEYFEFKSPYFLYSGDKITISTRTEEKYIQYLRFDGVKLNAMDWISDESTWLTCYHGENTVEVTCSNSQTQYLDTTIMWQPSYLGV